MTTTTRQPDRRTEADDLRMDLRVANHELLVRLNEERRWAFVIGEAVYTDRPDRALAFCQQMQAEAIEQIERLRARR